MLRARTLTNVTNNGQLAIGVGLAVVLAAQLWSGIPLAAAIALIGFGATLTLIEQRQHSLLLALNLALYGLIALLAIGAQFDIHLSILTSLDAVLAVFLTYKAATAGRAQN